MQDAELLRYSRHILLDDIGIEGQSRLRNSRVLIVGAGGLGSPAAMYLACAGVGEILLSDPDTVDLTNLQRQVIHTTANVGLQKVQSAAQALSGLNPDVKVTPYASYADARFLDKHLPTLDVVLDCSDNFATRQAVNAACARHRKPLVSGAAIGFDGQVSVYDHRTNQHACYACTFPPESLPPEAQCSTMGVFAPLVGIIGTVQAAEALKLLVGIGSSLAGRLLMLDARAMEWTEMRVALNPLCSVCGSNQPLARVKPA